MVGEQPPRCYSSSFDRCGGSEEPHRGIVSNRVRLPGWCCSITGGISVRKKVSSTGVIF